MEKFTFLLSKAFERMWRKEEQTKMWLNNSIKPEAEIVKTNKLTLETFRLYINQIRSGLQF